MDYDVYKYIDILHLTHKPALLQFLANVIVRSVYKTYNSNNITDVQKEILCHLQEMFYSPAKFDIQSGVALDVMEMTILRIANHWQLKLGESNLDYIDVSIETALSYIDAYYHSYPR